jgi:hypothetical protein
MRTAPVLGTARSNASEVSKSKGVNHNHFAKEKKGKLGTHSSNGRADPVRDRRVQEEPGAERVPLRLVGRRQLPRRGQQAAPHRLLGAARQRRRGERRRHGVRHSAPPRAVGLRGDDGRASQRGARQAGSRDRRVSLSSEMRDGGKGCARACFL